MEKKISNIKGRLEINELIEKIKDYDVISFDIFDTLILRKFEKPTDLFRLLSIDYDMVNFYSLRKKAEATARKQKELLYGHTEVTIEDIYKVLYAQVNIPIKEGIEKEFNLEIENCFANPYMKIVFDKAKKLKKKIIIVTDMYLFKDQIEKLLSNCGYKGYSKLYVSNDYQCTKRNGDLYDIVCHELNKNEKVLHIGDNDISDIKRAKEHNLDVIHYKRINTIKTEFDNFDMSPTIKSAYTALVKNKFYNGLDDKKINNIYYRYGYAYSGILVLGYVKYLHDYAKEKNIDKILFLSRDGYILKKIWDQLYNDIDNEYVLWSRHATLRISPEKDIKRYLWQFINRPLKNNKEVLLIDILEKFDLMFLKDEFFIRNINLDMVINDKIRKVLNEVIEDNIELLIENSSELKKAAHEYYYEKTKNSKNVCIVDIGYRGSGAIALKNLFKEWNFDCNVKTVIAYGLCKQEGFDDTLILNDDINSYCFSDNLNTDLTKRFQKNQLINMAIVEMLVSSAPKPSFLYFSYDEKGNIKENFDEDEEYDVINNIHEGIVDFANDYYSEYKDKTMLLNISGRDAHAPINSLLDDVGNKKFVNDFKNVNHDVLVPGVKSEKAASILDTYNSFLKERAKKQQTTVKKPRSKIKERLKKLKIVKKTNKFYIRITKFSNRLSKIKNSDILKARFTYTKYYENNNIDDKVMLFQSYDGADFSGSPYYIFKEVQELYNNYKFYIAINKSAYKKVNKLLKHNNYKNYKIIYINSKKYCKVLATAKYLINNRGFASYFMKQEKQVYIQTWHGTPLKGLGKDAKDGSNDSGNFQKNCFFTDYFIMPNKYTCDKIKKSYMFEDMYKGKYLLSGYPRNSIFLDNDSRKKIREELDLVDKKVIVYMPTWRRNMVKNKEDSSEFEEVFELLDRLDSDNDGNTIVYVKFHSLLSQEIDFEKYNYIKEFPYEYETYEFLNIADCLITDYSSVFFDFALTNKKIILFAYDKEEYINSITTYFPMEELPFPIVDTVDKVIEEINNKKINKITKDFHDKYIYLERKDTTKKICEYIFEGKKAEFEVVDSSKKNSQNNILVYLGDLKKNDVLLKLDYLIEEFKGTNKKIIATFNKGKVEKNKLLINKISDKVDYIIVSGNKNLTIKEGIIKVLYKKFKIKSEKFKNVIEETYAREAKRRFANLKFEMIFDFSGDSMESVYIYNYIDHDKIYYILNRNLLIPNKFPRLKKLFKEKKLYNNIYIFTNDDKNNDYYLQSILSSEGKVFDLNDKKMKIKDII